MVIKLLLMIIIEDIVVEIITLRGVKVDWWKKYQDKPGDTLLYNNCSIS